MCISKQPTKFAKGSIWHYVNPDTELVKEVRKNKKHIDALLSRPVLIISDNHTYDYFTGTKTVMVVPITTSKNRIGIPITLVDANGESKESIIMPYNIYNIAYSGLRNWKGSISESLMREVDRAIDYHRGYDVPKPIYTQLLDEEEALTLEVDEIEENEIKNDENLQRERNIQEEEKIDLQDQIPHFKDEETEIKYQQIENKEEFFKQTLADIQRQLGISYFVAKRFRKRFEIEHEMEYAQFIKSIQKDGARFYSFLNEKEARLFLSIPSEKLIHDMGDNKFFNAQTYNNLVSYYRNRHKL